jgi:hypothetical protein
MVADRGGNRRVTSAGTSSDTAAATASLRHDLGAVRLGQAQLLFRRTVNSCLIVQGVIIYFTALILFSGNFRFSAWWFALTSTMVLIVFLYSRLFRPGITRDNVKPYLRGHIVISGMTGLVWSSLAIAYLDPSSTLNLFISINIVASIALGGMLPSAEYRPSYVSLSTGMFLPFAVYWLITVDGPLRIIGVGVLILYGFGLLVSARRPCNPSPRSGTAASAKSCRNRTGRSRRPVLKNPAIWPPPVMTCRNLCSLRASSSARSSTR